MAVPQGDGHARPASATPNRQAVRDWPFWSIQCGDARRPAHSVPKIVRTEEDAVIARLSARRSRGRRLFSASSSPATSPPMPMRFLGLALIAMAAAGRALPSAPDFGRFSGCRPLAWRVCCYSLPSARWARRLADAAMPIRRQHLAGRRLARALQLRQRNPGRHRHGRRRRHHPGHDPGCSHHLEVRARRHGRPSVLGPAS